MSEIEHSIQPARTLAKAFAAAVTLAAIILLTIVLPAEYNIDPTGIGGRLGLTILSSNLASSVPEQIPGVAIGTDDPGYREDQTAITIPANKGLEYKFHLQQYGNLTYEWSSGDGVLYFDLHGEPDGDTTGYFESFAAANGNEMKGSITAPFAGSHGWYWRNGSSEDVVVNLKTQGIYEIIGLK